ncbi:hypothetical protein EUBSIR_00169 [[Eubacterium] siraeum DSM 15702]|uniref:Uncharacterized protein n=1 Tax=[Eubacterium] siraeum DSM 15702 TaxID=428128 RepID=B0MK37_9FIRM|nr:hypothetical protein EUBSIR_00169 [[Eubacterium] siraeum DSM 15702]
MKSRLFLHNRLSDTAFFLISAPLHLQLYNMHKSNGLILAIFIEKKIDKMRFKLI